MSSEVDKNDLITRREFTVESVMALLAGVTISVSSCGGDTETAPTSPSPGGGTSGNVNGTISANHGHRAVVDAARITAAAGFDLDIRGDATHPHTVTLTADDLRLIGARTQVTKTSSSDDGHTHIVTFN